MTSSTLKQSRWRSWGLPGVYVLLLAVGIPWYWPREAALYWWGIPAWVVIAVGTSGVASIFTACVLARAWPGEDEETP